MSFLIRPTVHGEWQTHEQSDGTFSTGYFGGEIVRDEGGPTLVGFRVFDCVDIETHILEREEQAHSAKCWREFRHGEMLVAASNFYAVVDRQKR